MKSFMMLILALLSCASAFCQQQVRIIGEVFGETHGYDMIYVYGKEVNNESVKLHNGHFEFTLPYKKGMVPMFYASYSLEAGGNGYVPFPLVIDGPGTVWLKNVQIAKGMNSGKWHGMASAETYQQLEDSLDVLNADTASVVRLFKTYIKKYPNNYATVFALNRKGKGLLNEKAFTQLYDLLTPGQRQSPAGQELNTFLVALRKTAIGQKVEDFTLPDQYGEMQPFSRFRGKYVLIDFWASWCGPCKASFTKMKAMYDSLQGKPFEIYSISIDKNRQAWINELERQQLPWKQGWDDHHLANNYFSVYAVPSLYLIGPDGKVLMRETGFDAKEQGILDKLFSKGID